ncbi:MAG: electron transfer flavoprotein subunit alpha/FixB family protein [Anaerolineaceae bacterium]|nr:electron transfer flavoprotein subunit alpha/FixB family protein [Anaerolineaceae bacterium]
MNQDIFVFVEHFNGKVSEITYMLLAQGREIVKTSGGKLSAILLGSSAEKLAANLAADNVIYTDDPKLAEFTYDAYLKVLSKVVSENPPRMFLFGDTSIGADISGGLSIRFDFPLVTFCTGIEAEGGVLKYKCQICGGKIISEGKLPESPVLVNMLPGKFKTEEGQSDKAPEITAFPAPELEDLRVSFLEFVEPSGEDIDISKESILIGIGRGIENQDNVEIAEKLAEALGGAVCATRPVIDQAWLPETRLVGKSGKMIAPRLYLAMGISGAPEHVESITNSEMIIAINSDPTAPIFNIAKYGVEEDLLDIAEALTEAIEGAKGG